MSWLIQGDACHLPLADNCVDLVFCSPPYLDARLYREAGKDLGIARKLGAWVEWMLEVVRECCRVSKGIVLVNCAGKTKSRRYQPGPEGLLYEWVKRGGVAWRPAYWSRVGIPGSGGKHWLRADIEYILCFKANSEWPEWSDNTANGHPPKWGPGGEMSHRLSDGARVNQWGPVGSSKGFGAKRADGSLQPSRRPSHVEAKPNGEMQNANAFDWRKQAMASGELPPGATMMKVHGNKREHTKRLSGGAMETQVYIPPVLANPGNLIQGIKVGGGALGSNLAHENEAPFPEKLVEWFVKGWCKPGGRVLDPFSGSGTTVAVVRRLGRIGIGMDLRWSQCELATRRLAEPDRIVKAKKLKAAVAEPSQFSLFSPQSDPSSILIAEEDGMSASPTLTTAGRAEK